MMASMLGKIVIIMICKLFYNEKFSVEFEAKIFSN